jgi:BirA family biotin operon repressor/biotin-[acetyl-CoA-carboxylase] ligase
MDRPAIDLAELRSATAQRWARVEVVAETGSTNADLLADADAPDRSVLVAESQTAGRGRLNRTWVTPPRSGLTFSVLLRPEAPIAAWGWLPLLAGVALHEAVRTATGVPVTLKWPNDLLHGPDDRKLAGILAQTSGDAVVIGIGLNVSSAEDELPTGGTSLTLCGATPDRTQLLAAILARLDARFAQWQDVGGDAEACGLATAYRDACGTLGREVAVTATDGRRLVGTAAAIDAIGRLVLRTADGQAVIGAGDVQHLRPS